MPYNVIYDGNCNLCVSLVKTLERLDQGERFRYTPMQDQDTLNQYGITPQDCELGMILINLQDTSQQWQGSNAAEEIGHLLPVASSLIALYQAIPGLKGLGDRLYAQVRDHRYQLFGQYQTTYYSKYPFCHGEDYQVKPDLNVAP